MDKQNNTPEPEVVRAAIEQLNANKPEQSEEDIERMIDMLENSRLNLRLPNNVFDALLRQAEFKKMTVEDYATSILKDSLETKVGAAWITTPSKFGNTPATTQKIGAPTYSVTRSNANQ